MPGSFGDSGNSSLIGLIILHYSTEHHVGLPGKLARWLLLYYPATTVLVYQIHDSGVTVATCDPLTLWVDFIIAHAQVASILIQLEAHSQKLHPM